jgi:1,2-diacylglycerol 3-alpha-glucosyltransferase
MNIAILFNNYGPYHLARIEACHKVFKEIGWDVVGVELSSVDSTYTWQTTRQNFPVPIFSIFGKDHHESLRLNEKFLKVNATLSHLNPDIIGVSGYTEPAMLSALIWSIYNQEPAILLSASKEDDASRSWWREIVKHLIIKGYKSALVGGKPQKRYLVKLGMASNSIFTGYNVVGIDDFHPDKIKSLPNSYQKPYFLTVNRFVHKKNVLTLVDSYAAYRQQLGNEAWDLVLCGDGELRPQIEQQIAELNLQDSVHLPGFLQQDKLLPYFAHASCFVHASIQEQWGLVVNEAMASGLPVLVSNRCGCYEDLIIEGVNGFGFDPENSQQLTELMLKMSSEEIDLNKMGQAGLEHIQKFSPDYFAQGLKQAVEYAVSNR